MTWWGIAVFVLLVLLLDVFIYSTVRAQLGDTLEEVLATRVELVTGLDEVVDADAELADRLAARGVPAVLTTADGRRFESVPVPRFDVGPPALDDDAAGARAGRLSSTVDLDHGGTVEVFVSRAGADRTLRRVQVVTLVGTAVAVLAALLLFRRAAAVAVAPLDHVVAAARRTAAGHEGERLDPDEPDTELGRLATAYDAMLDSLEDALDRTRRTEERTRRFLDDAAHQLRTPLAATRAAVEALLRESDPEVRDLLLAGLVREVVRADRLLTSLLTLARLEGGQPAARLPTDVVALCADEVDRCRSLAPHLDVVLQTDDAPRTPPPLDALAVREAVANLLDNARRHAAARIEVRVNGDDASIRLEVRDDGPGMDAATAERAFQRFASLDGRGGSGLGLPIARAIAEAHGGTLDHDGDVFVLRLPTGGDASTVAGDRTRTVDVRPL